MYLLPELQRGLSLKGEKEGRPTVCSGIRFFVDPRPIGRPMATADGLEVSDKTNPLAKSVGLIKMAPGTVAGRAPAQGRSNNA